MIEDISIVMIFKLGLYIMMKKDKKFGDIIIMLYFDIFCLYYLCMKRFKYMKFGSIEYNDVKFLRYKVRFNDD